MLCPRQPTEGEMPGFNLLMELLRGDHWPRYPGAAEMSQIAKTRQMRFKNSWKSTDHTWACNSLTIFEFGNLMTGNGNYVNLLKLCLGKFVKSNQCNIFSARFSHLEPIMWPTPQASTLWHQFLYLQPLSSRRTFSSYFSHFDLSLSWFSYHQFTTYLLLLARQIDRQRDCKCPRTLPAIPGGSPAWPCPFSLF